jgi:protein-S-isoprenylcysteine O-methyltransferase Ste14
MAGHLLTLGGAWISWCVLHSLLAWPSIVVAIKQKMGRGQSAYRVIYNLTALASLVPVAFIYEKSLGPVWIAWPTWLRPLLWLLRGLAFVLLLAGARVYPLRDFLGFPPGNGEPVTASRRLVVAGVLKHVRHPWYLAGLLLLWSRDLAGRDMVTAIVLSAYLWIGSILEERRLISLFGDDYRYYQSKVPRFLPRICRRR